MASLREAVTYYQDELRAGIAWIAFWREGRSWNSDYLYLEMDDTLTPEDRGRLQEIQHTDPAAVVLNGYYCGYLGEDMNLAELTAGVRRHYENGYNNIADFIEAHDNALSPEQIEEAREAAHAAGLPFSEKPYRDGDFDPYVFDGSMSAEDYELMHRMMKEERSGFITDDLTRIDTRSGAFDMQEIENRRFMYQPQTGTLILGRQYHKSGMYGSHAEEHADSGASEPYDSFIRGWIGTGKEYPHGIIHFAPNIDSHFAEQLDKGFSTLEMFAENGAVSDTVIRGFGDVWEQPLSNLLPERSERLSEVFSILIDNRSRFEAGELSSAWLSMPATAEQLHAAMQSVGITADNPQDFFINGYSYPLDKPLALPYDMVCAAGIDELNFLAARLEALAPADLDELNAAAQRKKGFENIGQIIDFTYNTDFFVHIPEVQTVRDLGDYYLNKSGMVDMPEDWKKGIDLVAFGRNAAEQERGSFTPYGYIVESGDQWERHYEGRDVPEEYRIMSYPQPPARPDPEKADFDAISTRQAATLTAEPPQPRPVIPIVLTSEKPTEKIKEITDRLEQGIAELFDSERYKDYLRVMSKFHNYSFRNTLLIAMQAPDASLVAGFNTWKNTHGRNVKRGEKGIKIFAPSPYKVKREVEKLDPQTRKPIIGKDGKPVTEEQEITVPAYKVVSVFDVSQTEGRELPDIAVDELTGDVDRYNDFFAALEKTSPVPIGFENIEGKSHGYYHLEEKRIAIQENMSELQTLKTAIHEIAHAKLHDIDLNAPKEDLADRPDRRTREVQAESVAYTVCQHYGLDTSDYSFGYVAGWSSGRELAELKASLETIRTAAAEIIDSIDGHFAELQKERETAKAQEAEKEPTPDLAAEPTVTIIWSESAELREGETMPLSRANTLFASLDEAELASPGYDKTKFAIDCVFDSEADHYEGRQDFGDGDGSLIDHIEKYHAHYENNADWENHLLHTEGKEAVEADKEYRAMLLHEFIPYLKLHCALSEMEQAATAALQSGESLTQPETAYHTAVQAYVAECRGKLNSGDYELPPAPRLADFDPELQAYKEHVREEIAQEAAAAGMTVEEYAANGYEPYPAAPEGQQQEQPTEPETPVFDKLPPEQQQKLSGEVKATLQMLIDTDIQTAGEVTAETLEAIATQGYAYRDGNLVKQDTPTELQKKAAEIAKKYESLPMQDRIGIIAQAFGCTSGKIETSPCSGKWRGTSDVSIHFDNGTSLFIGNHRTPKAKTAKVQNEYVNAALLRYNPEIIAAAKEAALPILRKREARDNEIAAQKGLKPYTLLNVEFYDGTDDKTAGHMGWYYVTLAVDGKIHAHMETGLCFDIAGGKVSESPTKADYYPAGAFKDTDVDYVFDNVGFSSTSTLYSLTISDEVRERAEKTLAEREKEQPTAEAPAPEQAAAKPEASVTYYPINEDAARRAKEAMSFDSYKPGRATAEYRSYVDKAAELAARQKKRVDPSFHAKIDGLLDTYARKLAANMNHGYEIAARVPSIMIAGGSNFPVRKKQKQLAADEKNMQEFSEIQGLLSKIRSTGMGGISADDPNAVSKLESKLAKREALQETMKAVNAYYRKHKTVDGCPHLTPEQIEKMKASISSDWRANPQPFESYQLSNNNAEIRRLKERIATLTRQKEIGYVGWEFDGGKVEANAGDNRLQIFFDEKPAADTREKLKEYGFRWSPSAGAWQRQLNDNAIRAADYLACIAPLTGERPTQVQKRAQQEAAAQDAPREKAAAPEYIYKMEANPRSESSNDRFFLQAYLPQEDGTAKIGDVLYIGTAEKCREIMVQLAAGELTQGEVKELYAKAQEAEPDKDTFSIYQLKRGDETRDFRFEPYDRLQAAGLAVDPANYDLTYTAPLAPDMSLDDIFTRFNIDHPADFKGHSLSVSDVVVLHQAGQDTAHYVDRFGYQQVPEFLQEQQELTPDARMTGEQIRTPRGSFHVTDMTREQMEAAGYGFHHQSEDGKYFIMGDGTRAFAVAATQPESPLKHIEDTVEQNDNSFDGIINNTPPTPTVDELEAKVQAGEQISLLDLADAIKADKERGGGTPEKKPSIRAQLKADKERAAQKKTAAKTKSQDLERS